MQSDLWGDGRGSRCQCDVDSEHHHPQVIRDRLKCQPEAESREAAESDHAAWRCWHWYVPLCQWIESCQDCFLLIALQVEPSTQVIPAMWWHSIAIGSIHWKAPIPRFHQTQGAGSGMLHQTVSGHLGKDLTSDLFSWFRNGSLQRCRGKDLAGVIPLS